MSQRQHNIKKYFNQSASVNNFQKDQLVLLWNKEKEKPSLHTKFEALWIGSYVNEKVIGNNSYLLRDMKGIVHTFLVNGKHLKRYFS
jgi:hypothetical protein